RDFFAVIVEQGRNPLTPLAVMSESSHESKLAFRIVPPLLVDTFHLSVEGYYVLQGILGVATLAGLAWLFHHVGYTRRDAALLLVGLSLTFMGAVWFLDTQPYFDAIAVSALVLALCVPHPAAVFLGGSIALWTDERSILALGVVALYHLHRSRHGGAVAAGAAFTAYVALRLWLGHRYGLSTGRSEVGPGVFFDYGVALPVAMLLALKGLIVVLAVGYWWAIQDRQWLLVGAGALTAGSLAISMMVNDVTRSTAYVLPGVVVAIVSFVDRPRKPLVIGLALCALPTITAIVATGAVIEPLTWFPPFPVRLLF
ncbi:MAG: hypothetical protein Q8K63_13860, partial [Acidimicrobiales bacterium]|nr:hypothetical protein [Acidimicrobiales bacterium]